MIAGLAQRRHDCRGLVCPERDRLRLAGLERQLGRRILVDRQTGQCDRLADRRGEERPCSRSAARSRARLCAISASLRQGNPSAARMLRNGSIATRRGAPAASIQSFAIPASRASSRTASSTARLQEGDGGVAGELAVRQRGCSVRGFKDHVAGRARERAGLCAEVAGERPASRHRRAASAPAPRPARSAPRRSPCAPSRRGTRCSRRKASSRR